MHVVQGQAQHYDWGDTEAIPRLLGVAPDGRPWAEFWWGTHAMAPSTIDGRPLADLTGPLPYLVKVLAAARPLSLQLHPSAVQAAAGFARDEAQGLAMDDPARTYRDPSAKPELVCALTPFEAVCGLAPVATVHQRLAALGVAARPLAERFGDGDHAAVLAWLLSARPALNDLVEAADAIAEPWSVWMVRTATCFPDDPAVGAFPLLNHVSLHPGEALFLGAGHLHAYLHGVGLEVMGPSDNVVRGGLTTKHVDIRAVLDLMSVEVLDAPVLHPVATSRDGAMVARFAPTEAPFVVERWTVTGRAEVTAHGDELWWCADGDVGIASRGQCVLARDGEFVTLTGTGSVFRVTVALPHPTPGPADAHGRPPGGSSHGDPTTRH